MVHGSEFCSGTGVSFFDECLDLIWLVVQFGCGFTLGLGGYPGLVGLGFGRHRV